MLGGVKLNLLSLDMLSIGDGGIENDKESIDLRATTLAHSNPRTAILVDCLAMRASNYSWPIKIL
ncbi:hypothetical protein D3Y57_19460 [Sphingomonas paeninsulae]|jgi:hypothetical protein|uniref:Uncharacterized protein n=1 Tax=Sphingomonas paeninsulae TaxID=2319844 RepID=A0A494TRG8_SPHPE|nr:hypothetical protein D3Y57_19460 [Sphingomonas paeninsulae]